jgi:membrane fusion protein, copper/silver efflux system
MSRIGFIFGAGLFLLGSLAGIGITYLTTSAENRDVSENGASAGSEPRILYWVAPMDPNFRSDSPGRSPMGMELIPVYEGDEGPDDGSYVEINPAVINNIGVRTARVHRQSFSQTVHAVGYVRLVDDLTSVVDVRSEGWIENLPVAAIGDQVEAGDLLFSIYAPDIATAQSEYLQAVRTGRQALIDASASRLMALGMSRGQIQTLARRSSPATQTSILSPRSGIVTELAIREGAFVRPGNHIMTIADLSDIWVIVDVFEDRIAQIEPGQSVRITTGAQRGREWVGSVEYIYPTVDPQSRTVPVRIRLNNQDMSLRPDTYVNAVIEAEPRDNVLMVPREAVIRTGQSERVIIHDGEGRFQPARIVTGAESDGMVEILSGIGEGELVVVSSQFLIDSEASLQGVMLRMSPPGEIAGSGHQTDPSLPDAPAQGIGVVDSLMAGHGMIDITHEPIEALDWPAMSMSFLTLEDVSLDAISVGDRVRFALQQDNDDWRISAIEPLEDEAMEHNGHQMPADEPLETDPHAGHGDHQ